MPATWPGTPLALQASALASSTSSPGRGDLLHGRRSGRSSSVRRGAAEADVLDEVHVAGGGDISEPSPARVGCPRCRPPCGRAVRRCPPSRRAAGAIAPREPRAARRHAAPASDIEPMLRPRPAPRRPAPDVRYLAESVGLLGVGLRLRGDEVASGDGEHPLIVLVAFEQFRAVRKKVGSGMMSSSRMIPRSSLREEPGDGRAHPQAAAEVRVLEQRVHLAVPVDCRHEVTAGLHPLGLTVPVGRAPSTAT